MLTICFCLALRLIRSLRAPFQAKSADMALTRTGLELKSTVEQLREQVQNVE